MSFLLDKHFLRILANLLVLASVFILPWWTLFLLSIFFLFYFHLYLEAVLAAWFFDILYSTESWFLGMYWVTFVMFLIFLLSEFLKRKIIFIND